MKRLKEFGAYLFLIVLAPIFVLVPMCTPAGAEECTATVSPDNTVHIPAVQFDTGLYSADLQYAPSNDGSIWFDVTGVSAVDQLQCENPALLSPVSGNYFLYVPSVAEGADKYWATLQYFPGTAAAQTDRAAAGGWGRAKVTKMNREDVMEPPGTNRVPTSMMFGSGITADQGPGGWKLNITVATSNIPLGLALPTLASPGWTFGANSGFLYVKEASCSYNQIVPVVTGTCHISGGLMGMFYIDSITIANVNSSNPEITMNYHISFPPNQIVTHGQLCANGTCFPVDPTDESSTFPNVYASFHQSEAQGGSIVATGWHVLPSLGSPCNSCGWPYAEKVYSDQSRASGPGSWKELRTHIVLYE